ncbi:MAG TPA: MoxR family ATPase, partial [Candidatus Eremiobacteraceae bacterium]|nr:MoxR family ATPase [Candidatus Eremiobacteraceae bacterium]
PPAGRTTGSRFGTREATSSLRSSAHDPDRNPPQSIDDIGRLLAKHRYIADRSLAVSIFLSITLKKPLFLEGEAGVGKTEVAKVLASGLQRPLIRLQCYEGLDINHAVYEWNYARQILHIRLAETGAPSGAAVIEREIFTPEFLIKRPLLQAIDRGTEAPVVLLIDEIDRADEEFEAFLLEVLSDFQITIPELGTFKAAQPPLVILTSNRTREVHDALKRRCLYHWIEYPTLEREAAIVTAKVPGIADQLAREASAFVASLRNERVYKQPGVAETIDWAEALQALGQTALDEKVVADTLGCLLKYQEDLKSIQERGLHNRIVDAKRAAANV